MTPGSRRVVIGTVALLAVAIAAIVLTRAVGLGPAAPSASFPGTVEGHPVITVSEAILHRANGDASDLSVEGWYQQPFLFGCPMPQAPEVPNIEGCTSHAGWLLERPEAVVHHRGNTTWTTPAVGPSVEVAFDGPSHDWARPLPNDGDAVPTPRVLVGHFHDPRAAACQPANVHECGDEFVVTRVAWANWVDNP